MAKPTTIRRIVVELRENDHGDKDVWVDADPAPLHEHVGLLELAKDCLLKAHP